MQAAPGAVPVLMVAVLSVTVAVALGMGGKEQLKTPVRCEQA